jgi:hypothetical protein
MAYETTQNEAGELEMSCKLIYNRINSRYSATPEDSAWKHRFSSQCLSVVHEQAFGARTPNYKVIQELDKKVRGFYIPPSLQVPGFSGKPTAAPPSGESEVPSLQLTMQRYTTWAIKEISMHAPLHWVQVADQVLYQQSFICTEGTLLGLSKRTKRTR